MLHVSGIFQSFVTQGQPARSVQAAQVPETDSNGGHSLYVSRTETRLNAPLQQATPAAVPTRTDIRSTIAVQQAAPDVGPIRTETRVSVAVQQATPADTKPTVQSLEVRRRQTTIPWAQTSVKDPGLSDNSPRRPTTTHGTPFTQPRKVEQNATHESVAEPSVAGMPPFSNFSEIVLATYIAA